MVFFFLLYNPFQTASTVQIVCNFIPITKRTTFNDNKKTNLFFTQCSDA